MKFILLRKCLHFNIYNYDNTHQRFWKQETPLLFIILPLLTIQISCFYDAFSDFLFCTLPIRARYFMYVPCIFLCTKSFTVLYDDTEYYSYMAPHTEKDTLDHGCWCSIHMYCPASQE